MQICFYSFYRRGANRYSGWNRASAHKTSRKCIRNPSSNLFLERRRIFRTRSLVWLFASASVKRSARTARGKEITSIRQWRSVRVITRSIESSFKGTVSERYIMQPSGVNRAEYFSGQTAAVARVSPARGGRAFHRKREIFALRDRRPGPAPSSPCGFDPRRAIDAGLISLLKPGDLVGHRGGHTRV